MKNPNAEALGSLGGKATKAKYGKEHYIRLAKNMNRKKKLKRIKELANKKTYPLQKEKIVVY